LTTNVEQQEITDKTDADVKKPDVSFTKTYNIHPADCKGSTKASQSIFSSPRVRRPSWDSVTLVCL